MALVLFERGLSIYLLALGTGVAAALVSLPGRESAAVAAASIPLFAIPAFGTFFLRLLPRPAEGHSRSFIPRAIGQVQAAVDRMGVIFGDRRLLLTWSLATASLFAIFTAQIWLLARGIAPAPNPIQIWVAFGASQLAGIASLLPFGLGAMDGSLAGILRKFGLTLEQGAATAVLFRAAVSIPYAIIAIACYVYLQRLAASRDSMPDAETGGVGVRHR